MSATVAFAVTAVLVVTRRNIDLFGAFFMGIVTAVGGGTLRDMILGVPVFWSVQQSYIWVALLSSIFAYFARRLFTQKQIYSLVLYLDGLGAALFGIHATDKVWALHFSLPVGPVMLGVLTAIGGGLIRDVLAGRETLLMTREIYAIPVFLGCTLFVTLLSYFPEQRVAASMFCILLTFLLRAAAIHWKLSMPHWAPSK